MGSSTAPTPHSGARTRNNYVLYNNESPWTDQSNTCGSFNIDGGSNMQDGTVKVEDNVFFASHGSLVYITTYSEEYLPDFEGNAYAQYGENPILVSATAPAITHAEAEEGIQAILKDGSAEYLRINRSDWVEAAW